MTRRSARLGVWVGIALGVCLALGGVVSAVRVATHAAPFTGVEWVQSAAGPVAIAVVPDGPAWAAGLRPGDLLTRLDGAEISNALEAGSAPWNAALDRALSLTVRRGSDVETLRLRPRESSRDEPYGYLALVGLAFAVSGGFVAVRWPTVRGGGVYAAFALAMYVRLVYSHTGAADTFDWIVHGMDLAAGILAPALLVHTALGLARRVRPAALVAFVYAPAAAAVAAVLWLHPAAGGGAYRFPDPAAAFEVADRGLMLVFGIAVVAAMVVLARAHATTRSGLHRGQLRWILWGLGGGLVPFLAFLGFPWALGAAELPSWARFLAVVPMLGVPAAFTAALARYRLNDLDLLLRRVFSEIAAVFLTAAMYAAIVFILRYGLDDVLGLSRSATRYVGFLLSAIAYPQLRRWMHTAVDRAFYKKRYSYRVTLEEWARELAAEVDLDALLGRLSERVRETLAVDRARVYVLESSGRWVDPLAREGDGTLRLSPELEARLGAEPHATLEERAAPGIPGRGHLFGMKVKGRLRAVLAVAERPSSSQPLTSEDRSLLATLAAHAATAIEAARLLREVRQQADEVRALHARERTILESSAVGFALLDADGHILAWNRALEDIYGLPAEEAIGRDLRDVFPLHFVRFLERRFADLTDRGETRVFRYTLVDREGGRRVLNLTISPSSGAEARRAMRVVTFDDVSEQVKLEEQVVQQERLASLGLLAAGVAHEVNTPLTGISSYTQMLLDELPDGDPRRDVLLKIDGQTRRASDIANSLLSLAQPERATFDALDLNGLIRDTLQLFDAQVRGRGIEVDVALDDRLSPIRGHRGKLQQVLLNLLINARDAVGREGRIRVRTWASVDRALLEVTDDGAGIAAEDLSRIFDPFFTTKGRGRGTGLGLSITYGIVHEHGGEIHVDSEPGTYTRFRIELPLEASARATG